MYFVLHQLRYSFLQTPAVRLFVTFLRDQRSGQSDQIEATWLEFLRTRVIPHLVDLWNGPERQSAQFEVEHEQVPCMALQWVGMAGCGIHMWDLGALPWCDIGRVMLSAVKLNVIGGDERAWDKHFEKVYQELSQLLPHRKPKKEQVPGAPVDDGPKSDGHAFDNYGFGRYMLTHKLRSFATSAMENAGASVRGWFGGDTMSKRNEDIHRSLGKPSVAQFKAIVDPESAIGMEDIEAGYYMCAIGDVVSRFASGGTTEEVMALRGRLLSHSYLSIQAQKRAAAQADDLDPAVEWRLPHNALPMLEVSDGVCIDLGDVERRGVKRPSPPAAAALPVGDAPPAAVAEAVPVPVAEAAVPVRKVARKDCPVCSQPQANLSRHIWLKHPGVADEHIKAIGRPRQVA